MKKGILLFVLLLLPILIYLFFFSGEHKFRRLPVFYPVDVQTTTVNGEEKTDTLYHTIPAFTFINQDGDTVSEKITERKIYVADFFFTTCPTICPKMSGQFKRIQEKYQTTSALLLLSHTVNPERDTAEALKTYSKLFNADNKKWIFLTGNKKEIYDMAIDGYKLAVGEDPRAPGGFLHSELFVLVDMEKRIRGYYDGTSAEAADKLMDDIRFLFTEYNMKESGEKKIIQKRK